MSGRVVRSLLATSLLTVILAQAPLSLACGPFTLETVFTFTVHPEYPLAKFAHGEIGVIQPTYARSYLFVAYRYLTGNDFMAQEEKALVDLWRDRLDTQWESNDQQWVQEWLTARDKVPGISAAPKIEVYRKREKPNEYETYLNCQQDAFRNAAATLEGRVKSLGLTSPTIKAWVEAQDQVFENCSEGVHLPASAPGDADSAMRADRAYQIAAASFYAGAFNDAKKLFDAISRDADSPWHNAAAYLSARTLVRKASLGAAEAKNEALAEAERELHSLLQDPKSASYSAARRLLNIVRIRLHPEERLHELAHTLLNRNQEQNLKQDLWDYTILLDGFVGDDESEPKKELPVGIRNEDLTDWIATFQSEKAEALEHSLEKWQAKSSLPWLIASLARIDAHHPKAPELLSAASKITPESPAFASVTFQSVRLAIQAGRVDEARKTLDVLLKRYRSRFNTSALNLLLSKRMVLANNLDDFLTYAQRTPAGFSFDDDGREIPEEESEQPEQIRSVRGKSLFDLDGAQSLNQRLPLALLQQAAESVVLPKHLRMDIAQAAWLRAVLLGDSKTADALVPTLETLIPELAPFLDEYRAARAEDAKKFLGIYTWLKFPGMEPIVDTGIGRMAGLKEQDIYRDNWWCSAAFPAATKSGGDEEKKELSSGVASGSERSPIVFLTESQRTAAEREWAALMALGAAPNYLCRQAIQWATKSPNDPRAPEALHLAVKTTRYGCTDKQTGKWSKAAYDLLHQRYPTSVWAKQTPYWFKD